MKVYDVRRTPNDGKSSHGLWPSELKTKTKQGLVQIGYAVSEEKII